MSEVIANLQMNAGEYDAHKFHLTLPDEVVSAWSPYLADNGFKEVNKISGNSKRYQVDVSLPAEPQHIVEQWAGVAPFIFSDSQEISKQHPEVEFKFVVSGPNGDVLFVWPDDWNVPPDDDFEWPDDWQ